MAFVLFGDLSHDMHAFLAHLWGRRGSTVMTQAFIEEAALALKHEVECLGALERSKVPSFRNLQQLNEAHRCSKRKHVGVENSLQCVTQVAHYLE